MRRTSAPLRSLPSSAAPEAAAPSPFGLRTEMSRERSAHLETRAHHDGCNAGPCSLAGISPSGSSFLLASTKAGHSSGSTPRPLKIRVLFLEERRLLFYSLLETQTS